MSWENKGSGGGGPWGGGGGGGGPRPPDLEEFIRRGQDRFKGFLPGGGRVGALLWKGGAIALGRRGARLAYAGLRFLRPHAGAGETRRRRYAPGNKITRPSRRRRRRQYRGP